MFFFNSPLLPPQDLNKPLPAISVPAPDELSSLTGSRHFRDGVHAMVAKSSTQYNRYVFIERGGAAWRGETVSTNLPVSFSMTVPNNLPKATSRYMYIGLEQKIRGHRYPYEIRSDIGIVVDSHIGRAVPFVTTKDPSLQVKHAEVLVWDTFHGATTPQKGYFAAFKNRYFTMVPESPSYDASTFLPGDSLTVSLQAVSASEKQSYLVLKLKSQDKTVIVRIPRDNTLLARQDAIKVHKVTSATVNPKKNSIMTPSELLICSTQGLSQQELMTFPALGELLIKAKMQTAKR